MNNTVNTSGMPQRMAAKLSALLVTALIVLSGCTTGLEPTQPGVALTQPGVAPTQVAASQPGVPQPLPTVEVISTAVVLLDTSGSVLATDLPAMAQNRLSQLVQTMPVGSRVVLRAVNSNITAMCQDLVISLPPQANRPVEDQVRQANQAAIAGKMKNYIECSVGQELGGTEFWGGLAETYILYPNAQVYAYGDTCENVTIRTGTCNPKRLRDPAFPGQVIAKLAKAGLIPQLQSGTTVTFIGLGRNAKLQAGEVAALRRIAILWSQQAGATASFATK